jgi:hypothetical protein
LIEKLDTLIRLLSLSVISGKSLREQIKILASAKFSHREIAGIVGTTADTVKVTLYKIRKERKKEKDETREQRLKNE